MNTPNTRLEARFLSPDVILCCGEDEQELVKALASLGVSEPQERFDFRLYQTRKYEDFTVILAPIGTGALEPLLYEIFSLNVVKRIVLVGTAARTPKSEVALKSVYMIRQAFLAGTGLDCEVPNQSFTPNLTIAKTCPSASIVSTDLYYGFKIAQDAGPYRERLPRLQEQARKYTLTSPVDLVDMEVAQFYALCQFLSGLSPVKYLAIKGPANSLDQQENQNINTQQVLFNAFRAAFDVLGVKVKRVPTEAAAKGDSEKMMEEIKLYWTIQIASAAVLGFLASRLDFRKPLEILAVCFPAFLLLTVGAIYNLVGNYYIYVEGTRLRVTRSQENVVAPHLCCLYLIFGLLLGGLMGYCTDDLARSRWLIRAAWWRYLFVAVGAVIGGAFVWWTSAKTYWALRSKGTSEYGTYSEPLRWLLGPWRP